MACLKAVYRDCSPCDEAFHAAIQFLDQRLISQAEQNLEQAMQSVPINHPCYNKYVSFLGFVRVLNGDFDSLDLCRQAAACESRDGDIFLNLARAEIFCGNRYAAVLAMNKGLSIDFAHEGLLKLRDQIGRRRKNFLPFLSRSHPINHLIGRRLRSRYG